MKITIEISEETYNLIKDQLTADEKTDISDITGLIGQKWFFRTVTYHMVGKVEKLIGRIAYMTDSSWVADSGRFMDAIKYGKLSEVEPVGECYINLDTVTDFFPWKHELPKDQK